MTLKSDAFQLLDEWNEFGTGDEVRYHRDEIAMDLADEFEIDLDEAYRLIEQWMRESDDDE